MNSSINERINQTILASGKSVTEFAQKAGIPQTTLNEAATKNKDIRFSLIEKIYNYSDVSLDWLITGKGEMLKSNVAGRDNVGTGNEIAGDNKGVVGNTGTVGNVGGNHLSVGDASNIKKIIEGEKVTVEFAQSVELLQQQNEYLQTRVNDLLAQLDDKNALIKSKDDMLEMYKSIIGKQ